MTSTSARLPRPLFDVLRTPQSPPSPPRRYWRRLPRGMASLAIVLLVHRATGSYATAVSLPAPSPSPTRQSRRFRVD